MKRERERVSPDSTLHGGMLEGEEGSLPGASIGRGLLEDMLLTGSSSYE